MVKRFAAALIGAALLLSSTARAEVDVNALYGEHCSECHAPTRLGAIGPALLPSTLGRVKRGNGIENVITKGREATQMPAFEEVLKPAEIKALAAYVITPPKTKPTWDAAAITASHTIHKKAADLVAKPVHGADLMNLFTVVEAGDHFVTILDGDKFEPLYRFQTHFAVHGGAKYSPDGRFVYLSSRDGWITKHDLWGLEAIAETRAGINTRNIAVSADGKWVMAGNFLPHNLVLLNAEDLTLDRVIPVANRKGDKTSRVSAVYDAAPRQSFIAALKDLKEVWELSYDPEAAPVYEGFAHNYRKGEEEGLVLMDQPFAIWRIPLNDYMDDFFFDPYYAEIIGASRDGTGGTVYNMDARKKVSDLDLEGMPHLGSGIVFTYQGRMVMATPHLKKAQISVIDMESWDTVKIIPTKGPGFFMRGHENSKYAWVDVFFGPNKDVLHVIDLEILEIARDIIPEKGKINAHVEFTKDGAYALVSVMENDGALVIYDAKTFAEIKRLPMNKPIGKYNVFNKITRSRGTSH